MGVSYLGAAADLLITSQVHVASSYLGGVLPGMVVLAISFGLGFAPHTQEFLERARVILGVAPWGDALAG